MRNRSRHRCGMSLIETAIILALSAVLLMVVAMTFSALVRGQRQYLVRERERREFNRFDAILRQDAHAATQARCATEDTCELSSPAGSLPEVPDERFKYHVSEDRLIRERIRAGKRVQLESFQVRKGTKVRFKLTTENERTLLQVDLEPPVELAAAQSMATAYRGVMLVGGLVPQTASPQRVEEGQP